jgi:putative membrane protein
MDTLAQTFVLRPYVFAFLAAYLVAAIPDLGPRRTALFGAWTFAVAWTAEFASTRVGVPFGLYHYTGATRGQELFLANVPFFDSLSFVFLAYASYCLARTALDRAEGLGVVVLAGVVMTLLDVVIDPLAVRGDRWFLGHLFYYPDGGAYFGVPLSNFAGWFVVGCASVGGVLMAAGARPRGSPARGVALYYGVLLFNLVMTWWIGEMLLLACGVVLHMALAALLLSWRRAVPGVFIPRRMEARS